MFSGRGTEDGSIRFIDVSELIPCSKYQYYKKFKGYKNCPGYPIFTVYWMPDARQCPGSNLLATKTR